MKTLITILLLLVSGRTSATCDVNFTEEQNRLLYKAFEVAKDDNLGFTLAAITWKESFVGSHIVRINNTSGDYGSYGVTHIQLSTAMWLVGETDLWAAKAVLIPKLITNDAFALSLGLEVLKQAKNRTDNYRAILATYNAGFGRKDTTAAIKYAEDVAMKVKYLQQCYKGGT